MYFNQHIKVRIFDKVTSVSGWFAGAKLFTDSKSLMTTVPFLKDNQFDYNMLIAKFHSRSICVGGLCFGGHFYHYGGFQWGEYYGWN